MSSQIGNTSTPPEAERDMEIMCPSAVADRLDVMILQESSTYLCYDYLKNIDQMEIECSTAAQKVMDEKCREKMCEWCFQVVDFLKFRRETVGIAMSYLDRFLCSSSERALSALVDRKEYQLAAMESLHLALKLNEPIEIDFDVFCGMSRGSYTEQDFATMEKELLSALNWCVNGPSSFDFIEHFLELLPEQIRAKKSVTGTLREFSRLQAELAVSDYYFVTSKPSAIALASLRNALDLTDLVDIPDYDRSYFLSCIANATGLDSCCVDVESISARLIEKVLESPESKLYSIGLKNVSCKLSGVKKSRNVQESWGSSPVCVSRKVDFHDQTQ